jgi:trimethylamine:corrinoid methyltransferase-like protein
MSILAGEKFTNNLVKKYVRRDMLMNSPIYNEWVEEERREAAEKAAKEAAKEATKETTRNLIKETIDEKFDIVPKSIYDKLAKIDNIDALQSVFKKTLRIDSIDKLEKLLDIILK